MSVEADSLYRQRASPQADSDVHRFADSPTMHNAGHGIGAKRTCYFNVGYIEETVTAWSEPFYLGLSIDRTHMPGRHCLGFESAEYRLQPNERMTRLTRTTTISSHLHPAWYWRPFERLGVESEHDYILQDIVRRVTH